MKSFKEIVFGTAEENADKPLHAQFGINDERMDKLEKGLDERQPKNLKEAFEAVRDLAETPEEFAFAMFMLGANAQPDPMEALLSQMIGNHNEGPTVGEGPQA